MQYIHLLIKPVSGACNMKCAYCFYMDEADNREKASYGKMSKQTVRQIVKRVFEEAEGECGFTFQGGEPTLAGLEYYEYFLQTVEKYNRSGLPVQYCLQTNGYHLTEEWFSFFQKNHFLIGVSLDGMQEIHDANRRDANGDRTFQKVMQTIHKLKEYSIPHNILTVVTDVLADHTSEIYRFYKEHGIEHQQYIECLDPLEESLSMCDEGQKKLRPGLTNESYERFLKSLFDEWYQDMKNGKQIYNRYFYNLLWLIKGRWPESCNMRGTCSLQWTVEADGSIYPCDFYVLDEWKLGNVQEDSFGGIWKSEIQKRFLMLSADVPKACKQCKWSGLCRNGCMRNCGISHTGQRNKNRFCEAYKGFLEYAYPRLKELAAGMK